MQRKRVTVYCNQNGQFRRIDGDAIMLTNENYFSRENQLKYMGASQFKSFMKCEAATIAEINGEYEREKTVSLLVGSYVDAHFEGTLDIFRAQNPEIYTQKGTLKSEYKQAEYIIERVSRDEMFMRYMSGEKQVIKFGDIDGVPFKIKIDSFHPGKCIVDLKVMKDFQSQYKEGQGRLNFIEFWGYDFQAAIYQAIEGNSLPFFIAGATKEKEPDIAIISIPQANIDVCLEIVKSSLHRFTDLKKGVGEPIRCEKCDYCKMTKKLDKILSMEDLE